MGSIHKSDAMMSVMTSLINDISVVYSIFCSGADQRKYQSSASLAFVGGGGGGGGLTGDRWIPRTRGH